jgi:hypothetical protein
MTQVGGKRRAANDYKHRKAGALNNKAGALNNKDSFSLEHM